MKTFRITSWTVMASSPDVTQTSVAILTQIGSITKSESYELTVPGRHDSLTPVFEESVRRELLSAGLL